MPANLVVLPDRPLNGKRVTGDIRGEDALGAVDVAMRTGVLDHPRLGRRDNRGHHPPGPADLTDAGNKNGRRPSPMGKEAVVVSATGIADVGDALSRQRAVQLADRP